MIDSTDTNEIRKHLFSLTNRGIKYNLDRIREAARKCGKPQLAYPCFHVAGTNGKGSTCAFLQTMLQRMGYRTGLFTSPHLIHFEERFQIDGVPVAEELWREVYEVQREVIDELHLTFFEATTLMAFELFKRNGVEWAIFETGLGGRFDATNIVKPEVSVITKIAMDHMDYLGDSLAAIASEKLGIVKEMTPLVFADNQDASVMELVRKTCAAQKAPCSVIGNNHAGSVMIDESGSQFFFKGVRYTTAMSGTYQVLNAMLALEAMECAGLNDRDAMVAGIRNAFVPGRFQLVHYNGKKIIFDVGHNPDAAEVLIETIHSRFQSQSICIVTGIMRDKDWESILKKYCSIADKIIVTRPATDRAALPEMLRCCINYNTIPTECIDTVADAVTAALKGTEEIVCIAGSFFTVGEALVTLGINPYLT